MYQRKYEVFFIVDPDLPDSDLKSLETRLKEIVTREGGTTLSYNSWGKKKLTYSVKKRTRGHYFLMEFAGGPDIPQELERNLKIDERVLKFITVKLEDSYVPGKEDTKQIPPASSDEESATEKESSKESDEEQ
ncbi:MAG: 30S ribosomal protein S6 [Thermodesulforhabdaceae bacterium]